MGVKKPDPAFWEKIYAEIGVEKDLIFVVDDDIENIESARVFGFQTHLYTNFEKFKNVIY